MKFSRPKSPTRAELIMVVLIVVMCGLATILLLCTGTP